MGVAYSGAGTVSYDLKSLCKRKSTLTQPATDFRSMPLPGMRCVEREHPEDTGTWYIQVEPLTV